MNGLLKQKAIKWEDRPLWFDVYAAYPPIDEPSPRRKEPMMEVRRIFYPEDIIRAKFYERFPKAGIFDLRSESKSICERFLEEYEQLATKELQPEFERIFRAASDLLTAQGVTLNPPDSRESAAQSRFRRKEPRQEPQVVRWSAPPEAAEAVDNDMDINRETDSAKNS